MMQTFPKSDCKLHSVVDDGNCLFRSVPLQLLGSEDSYRGKQCSTVEELQARDAGPLLLLLVANGDVSQLSTFVHMCWPSLRSHAAAVLR